VLGIQAALASVPFDAATSAWPDRFVRKDAKKMFEESITRYLKRIGWEQDKETEGDKGAAGRKLKPLL